MTQHDDTNDPSFDFIPGPPRVGFVSRRDSKGSDILLRLREVLESGNELVVLWGAGGVGKTALAAEAARSVSKHFGRRIIWISADGRAAFSFSTLLNEIAIGLNRRDLLHLANGPKENALEAVVTAAPTLIVLDNLETVSRDEATDCWHFLARIRCSALVTTRERLDDAQLLPLPPMSAAEAMELLLRMIDQFGEPSLNFKIDRNSILSAAEFNPLIIQWIVAQIGLAHDPQEVLTDLAHGEGDAAHRVFNRSYDLPQLGEDSREVLLALSLFAPGASRPALSYIAGFDGDLERLKEATKSLSALLLIDDGERVRVEGLTRALALARLSRDPHGAEIRQRFVEYFLRFAESHQQPTAENYNALEFELGNILGAIDIAYVAGSWEKVMRLVRAAAFPGILDVRGHWEEAIKRGDQAVSAARADNANRAVAEFAGNTATIRMDRGEYEQARLGYEQALEAFSRLRDNQNIAVALHQLGRLAQAQGDLQQARQLYDQSLEINTRLGNQSGIASTLGQLAILAQDQGDFEQARQLYDQSLEINTRLGNQSGIAVSLHQMAMLAQVQSDIEEAKQLYNQSLEIASKLGNQSGIATTLHQLAMLAENQGELEEARQIYNQSLEIKKKLGDQSGIAITLHQLATLAEDQGELEDAKQLYKQSLEIAEKLGDQRGIASTTHQLGRLSENNGNTDEAARMFRESLTIFEKLGSPNAEMARRNLARVEGKTS